MTLYQAGDLPGRWLAYGRSGASPSEHDPGPPGITNARVLPHPSTTRAPQAREIKGGLQAQDGVEYDTGGLSPETASYASPQGGESHPGAQRAVSGAPRFRRGALSSAQRREPRRATAGNYKQQQQATAAPSNNGSKKHNTEQHEPETRPRVKG